MVVRVAVLGAVVDVAEDAEAELGVLVQHFALGDVVAEMRLDKIVVLQHLLDQGAYLLASLDARILLEDPAAFRRKLLEAIPHLTNSLMASGGCDSRLNRGAIVTRSGAGPQSGHEERLDFPIGRTSLSPQRPTRPQLREDMYSYIIRRLAFGALTVVGVSIIVFVVLRILPGDPLVAIFGPEGFTKLSEAERARYMADLGLSDPLAVQYLPWVGDIVRGNFGRSFFRAESVGEMILRRGPLTAEIAHHCR